MMVMVATKYDDIEQWQGVVGQKHASLETRAGWIKAFWLSALYDNMAHCDECRPMSYITKGRVRK